MDESIAVRRQELADFAEILVKMSDADMLHHADRDQPVKLSSELAIVQLAKHDAVGNSGGLGIDACCLDLLGRNIDRGHVGTGFARQMNGEAAPAGADLCDGHTR